MAEIDDEIDLRHYILVLSRHWWLILILGAVAGVVALAVTLTQPRKYEAIATILLTRKRPTLSLAVQFPTVSEPIDTVSRMNALLSLAQNDALAAETLNAIQEKLPEEARTIETIKDMVEVTNSGDAILIKASAEDPGLSAEIANSWAKHVVSAVNQAYSGEQLPPEIEDQLKNAQLEYVEAQSTLEDFYHNNDITYTQIQVKELEILLNNINKEQGKRLLKFIDRKLLMEEIIVQAEALKQQLGGENGSAAANAGDALAVLLARAGSFGISRDSGDPTSDIPPKTIDLSIDLQLTDFDSLLAGKTSYERDLERLIQQAEIEKSKAQETIQVILQEIVSSQQDQAITDISTRLQSLQSQLTNLQATESELTSQRDLTWNAYQALAEKVTEIKNAAPATAQLNLASPAIPPEEPNSRGTVRNTLIAIILGCGVAMLFVLVDHWWRSSKQPDPDNPSNPLRQ